MADNITNNRKRKCCDPHVAGGAAEYQDDFLDGPNDNFMAIMEKAEIFFENQGNIYKLFDAYLSNENHQRLKKAKTDFQKLHYKYHQEKRAMSKAMSNLSVNMGNLKDCAGKLFDLFEAQFAEREDLHRKLNKAHEVQKIFLHRLQSEQELNISFIGKMDQTDDNTKQPMRSKSSARQDSNTTQ
uniref:Uncharacterized protein n=1 Tax=Lutzomyia longipalpis TaxID=7200 RepID=A0A1B0CCN2_LUTLO